MNIIWLNIAGSGQVYAQREGDASASATIVESESRGGGKYCATKYFEGIYCEMRSYTGHQLSYLWSVRVIPIRTIILSDAGFRMSKTNGSRGVSEIHNDFLALQYKQINRKKIRGQNCRVSRLGN